MLCLRSVASIPIVPRGQWVRAQLRVVAEIAPALGELEYAPAHNEGGLQSQPRFFPLSRAANEFGRSFA